MKDTRIQLLDPVKKKNCGRFYIFVTNYSKVNVTIDVDKDEDGDEEFTRLG